MMQSHTKQGPGNPLMFIPLIAVLAYLDYETNGGQTIAAVLTMIQQVRDYRLPAINWTQLTNVAALVVIAIVIFSFSRNRGTTTKALTVASANHKATRMPSGMPRRLVSVVSDVLATRSNNTFWLDGKGSTVTPLAWTLAVEYADGTEPDKLGKYVTDIENRLYGAGLDVSVRVSDRPLSLTIDNPKPPVFTLRDYWKQVTALPQNERLCAPAVQPSAKGMQLVMLPLRNMGAGTLVAGMPGAGKTQFTLSAILSLCMANSPQRVSLIIADVKAADTMPLSGLPHLACPVVTDTEQIANVLDALVAEMSNRMARSALGDRAWMQHSICVVVDELAELIIGTGRRGATIATNLQRLSQAGRGMGIILIVATQRVYDIPAEVYSKIDRRCVFRVASASDSVAASGSAGTHCNLLPKRGALEIFSAGDPSAQRVQGLFVADAESATYEATLHSFVADVQARWGAMMPGWVYVPSVKVEDDEDDSGALDALVTKYGSEFVDALIALADEDKLTGDAVGKVYQSMTGKGMSGKTRKMIREIVMDDLGVD